MGLSATAALLVVIVLATVGPAISRYVLCYHGTWSTYRPDEGKFGVEDIDPFLCTHLVYAFFGIEESGELRIIDPYLDLEDNGGRGNIKKFNALKLKNPTLKTLAAVGGWNEGSKKFSLMAAEPEKRARFIGSVVKLLQRHGFDGLDLDWEYPAQRHSLVNNNDTSNFITLLEELKQELEPFGFVLSAAVGAAEFSAQISYDIPKISGLLDLINLMSYDLHGPWDPKTGIIAPLNAGPNDVTTRELQLNVDAIVRYWLEAGAPKNKLLLGLPFYGRTFTLANNKDHGLGAPHIGRGLAGKYSREPGVMGYNEICEQLQQDREWTTMWEYNQEVPYAYKDRQWVGYENESSVALKAQLVVDMDLAGVMIWSLESDDFHGSCSGKRNPLLHSINQVLFGQDTPSGLSDNDSNSDPIIESEFKCSSNVGYIRDPHNCSKYYYCNAGATFTFECPNELYFDPKTTSCNYAQIVTCSVDNINNTIHM